MSVVMEMVRQVVVVVFVSILLICWLPSAASSMRSAPGFVFTKHPAATPPCTPQYWGSRIEAWPKMVPQRSTVSNVFGSRAVERFRSDLTLLEATTRNDDVENTYMWLLKQCSAALLNSYARVGFPYRPWEVKTMLIQGLISKDSAAQLAQILSKANQACT